jgi:HlyD family secretion protein
MNKTAVILVVVPVLALGAYGVYKVKATGEPAKQGPKTAEVALGSIKQVVASTGRIVSNLDVDIKCKASGEVVLLPFDISDTVKKGDLLLKLDPIDEKRQVTKSMVAVEASGARLQVAQDNLRIAEMTLETDKRRAQAQLESAQVLARDEQSKADRVKSLLEKKLASQEEFDTAQTSAIQAASSLENAKVKLDELKTQETALALKRQDVKLAQTQVELDKIALTIAQDRLMDTEVNAPMNAVVTTRNVQTGQIIASGVSNVGGGTTVLTLSDMSRIFVLASVDESEIGRIKVGQKAMVTVDAFPGRVFNADVVRIASKGVTVSNVVTFEVKLELTGEERNLLKPEMTANVEILTAKKDNVLYVPFDSVLRENGRHMVTVVEADGSTRQQQIETGILDTVKIEVVKGLTQGQNVVIYQSESQSRWSGGNRPANNMVFGGPGRRH